MSPQMTLISVLMISANLLSLNAHRDGSYRIRGGGVRAGEARGTIIRGPNDGLYAHGEARGFRAGGGSINGRRYYGSDSWDRRRLGHVEDDSYHVRGGGVRTGEARGTVVRGPNDGLYAHGQARGFRAGGGAVNGRYNYHRSRSSDSWDRRRLTTVGGGGISAGEVRGTVIRGPNDGVYAHGQARGFRAGGGAVYDSSDSSDRRRLGHSYGYKVRGGEARGTFVDTPYDGIYAHGETHRFRAGGSNVNGRYNGHWSRSSDRVHGSQRRLSGMDSTDNIVKDIEKMENMMNNMSMDSNVSSDSNSSDSEDSDRRRLGHEGGSYRGGAVRAGEARGTVIRGPNDGVYAHGEARGFRAGGGRVNGRYYSNSWDNVHRLHRRLLGEKGGKNGNGKHGHYSGSDSDGSWYWDSYHNNGRHKNNDRSDSNDGVYYVHGEVRGYHGDRVNGRYYDFSDSSDRRNGKNDRNGDDDRDHDEGHSNDRNGRNGDSDRSHDGNKNKNNGGNNKNNGGHNNDNHGKNQ